jgi:transposase InsO family protein
MPRLPKVFLSPWKREEATAAYETRTQACQTIACTIHGFYNPTRIHSTLNYLSPNVFAKYLRQNA